MPKQRTKEENRIYQLERYHRLRIESISQLGGRCVICGTTDTLEFHHINPEEKSFTIGDLWSIGRDKIQEELKKCELRCSKHHKEVHQASHGTLGYYRHQKCRCDLCRDANRVYHLQLRKLKRDRQVAQGIGF